MFDGFFWFLDWILFSHISSGDFTYIVTNVIPMALYNPTDL